MSFPSGPLRPCQGPFTIHATMESRHSQGTRLGSGPRSNAWPGIRGASGVFWGRLGVNSRARANGAQRPGAQHAWACRAPHILWQQQRCDRASGCWLLAPKPLQSTQGGNDRPRAVIAAGRFLTDAAPAVTATQLHSSLQIETHIIFYLHGTAGLMPQSLVAGTASIVGSLAAAVQRTP